MADTARLRLVHRDVGGADEVVEALAVARIQRRTDGTGDRDVADDR